MNATKLEETQLYKQLKELEDKGEAPPGLSGNVLNICAEAANRLKIFPAIHGQFTLHDETHSLRVTQLMASVAGTVLPELNAVEIALLILAAYFHDLGMIVDAPETNDIKATDDWQLHEQNWITDHPNYRENATKLTDPLLTVEEKKRLANAIAELNAAMFTDYIRKNHGERSGVYIQKQYGEDPRLKVYSQSLESLLAKICVSHCLPADEINPSNGFQYDVFVGTKKVNLALLAYILRLADILDFDCERTPDSLYRAIHFTSNISLLEWEKHRCVTGWEISSEKIVFAAECKHPIYERTIRNFFDWINIELSAIDTWGRSLPSEFAKHRLQLPLKLDESRVGPYNNPVNHQPAYIQSYDLEFSISRDEIVKLLMTDQLYSNKSLFIRELLQNALDALRYRKALHQSHGTSISDLRVEFEHGQDSGIDIVRCKDNGVGMDENIVTKFLTRVGRSYYRSPEFQQERTKFSRKNCDFDPCARFGIGFMSCFMFGDEITIWTRRDHGPGHNHGSPLIVEIKGLSGIVVVRPGSKDQPIGTLVEIRSRTKSYIVDHWNDPVNLIQVLEGYALAVEYPITATCDIPAIEKKVIIQPSTTVPLLALEDADIHAKEVFTVDFSEVDERLGGQIKVCTLTDEAGIPSISNHEAHVELCKDTSVFPHKNVILTSNAERIDLALPPFFNQLCCDGILVAGKPGRHERYRFSGFRRYNRLGWTSLDQGFGDASFILDVRNNLKPTLTPARTPPNNTLETESSWQRLFTAAAPAYSKLLEDILYSCTKSEEPDRFWVVAEAYNLDLMYLPLIAVWKQLRLPVENDITHVEWLTFSEIGNPRIKFPNTGEEVISLSLSGDKQLIIPTSISSLNKGRQGLVTHHLFNRFIIGMSQISIANLTEFELTLHEPNIGECLADTSFCFDSELSRAICITGKSGLTNSKHPVVRLVREIRHIKWNERSPLERILTLIQDGNDKYPFDTEAPANSRAARNRKELGMLSLAADWATVDTTLKPPYQVFRPGLGFDTLTLDHLSQWAKITIEPDSNIDGE